jgi:hypothetical protein
VRPADVAHVASVGRDWLRTAVYPARIEDICNYPVISETLLICDKPDVSAGIPLLDK